LKVRLQTGIEYQIGGTTRVLSAQQEVLLCAGAIGSPQLLQVSGVGPKENIRGWLALMSSMICQALVKTFRIIWSLIFNIAVKSLSA
jgi:hypothetical protein